MYIDLLPDEIIEYIYYLIHKDNYSHVLNELILKYNEKNLNNSINKIVSNYIDTLIDEVIDSLNT